MPQADEELYIDLKMGISIAVPASWKREKVPVSSPAYTPDSVRWRMKDPGDTENYLQIRSIPQPQPPVRQSNLAEHLNLLVELPSAPFFFEHPGGPALRSEFESAAGKIISLTVVGQDRIYFVTSSINLESQTKLQALAEKAIRSFTLLHD